MEDSLKTVAVFNIPLRTCKKKLRKALSSFGKVASLTLKTMKRNLSMYAFVKYGSESEAHLALKTGFMSFGHSKLFLKEYNSEIVVRKGAQNPNRATKQ